MSYTKTVLTDLPLAYYKLSETSGASAADSSGNSRTATYSNLASYNNPVPSALLDNRCIAGVELDGASSSIGLGSSTYLNGSAQITVEFFAKFLNIPGTSLASPPAVFFCQVNAGSWVPAFALFLNNNTVKVQARSALGDSDQSVSYSFTDTTSWHHIIAHFDYNGKYLYLYIDGTRVAAQSVTFGSTTVSLVNNISVGLYVDGNSASIYSQFMISDLAIYKNTAVNQAWAYRHYFNAFQGYSAVVLNDSPVLYWKMNEPSGTNVVDYSGNNRVGTAANIVAYSNANSGIVSEVATGMSSNGSSTAIAGPAPSFLSGITQLTIEMWFKAINPSASGVNLFCGTTNSAGYTGFGLAFNSNTLVTGMRSVYTDAGQNATIAFSDTTSWHHVVVQFDWALKKMFMYLDNVLQLHADCTLTNTTFTPGNVTRLFCFPTNDSTNGQFAAAIISNMSWYVNKPSSTMTQFVDKHYRAGQLFPVETMLAEDCPIWYPLATPLNSATPSPGNLPAIQHTYNYNQSLYTLSNSVAVGAQFYKSFMLLDSLNLDPTNGFTISILAKLTDNTNSGILFYLGNGGLFHSISAGYTAGSTSLYFKIYNGYVLDVSLVASNVLTLNEVRLCQFIYDPVNHVAAIAIDGSIAVSTSYNGTLPLVPRTRNYIGCGYRALKYLSPNINFNQEIITQFFDSPHLSANLVNSKGLLHGWYGVVAANTDQARFGHSSLYLNGQNSTLILRNWDNSDVNIGDFTVECWIYAFTDTIAATTPNLVSKWQQTAGYYGVILRLASGKLTAYFGPHYTAASNYILQDANTLTANVWHHVAVCRRGNSFYLLKDGLLVATNSQTYTGTAVSVPWAIGQNFNSSGNIPSTDPYGRLFIDSVIVTKGTAKYPGPYVVSTQAPKGIPNPVLAYLMIHCNGANNATSFPDDLGTPISVGGNAKISTAQYKFNGSSGYFDGSSACKLSTSVDLSGAADLTIDFWYYAINGGHGSNYARIFHLGTGNVAGALTLCCEGSQNPAQLRLSLWTPTEYAALTNSTIPNTTWTHIALVRRSYTWYIFVNGVQQTATITQVWNVTQTTLYIGSSAANESFYGYLAEFRIVKGTALYPVNFSDNLQKTSPYALFNPYAEEVYLSYLALLLNFNGNNNAQEFFDVTGKSVTVAGSTKITNASAMNPLNMLSGAFNGTTDYLDFAYDSSFDLGVIGVNTNTTIEFWIKSTITTLTSIISHGLPGSAGTGNVGWAVTLNNGTLSFSVGATSGVATWATSSQVIVQNQWHNVAVVMDAGVPRIFVDGTVKAGSFTAGSTFIGKDTTTGSYGIRIGACLTDNVTVSPTNFLNGNLDQLRVTSGICRYYAWYPIFTTDYLENNTIDYTDDRVLIENNILLMDFEVPSTAATDSSARNRAISLVGTAQASSTVKKYYATSFWLSGTGTGFSVADSSGCGFGTADFTVECWIYLTSAPARDIPILDFRTGTGQNGVLYVNGSGSSELSYSNDTVYKGSTQITTSAWHHVALSRVSGTTYLFLDGTSTYSTATAFDFGSSRPLKVGLNYNNSLGFVGYIDEVRITKGYGRYSAGFTAPTVALPVLSGDTSFASVSLLMHGDSLTADVTGKTLAVGTGTVSISSIQGKFGGSSLLFNGTGYLTASASAGYSLGTGDFTAECWVYIAGNSPLDSNSCAQAYTFRMSDDTFHILELAGNNTTTGVSFGIWDGSHWDDSGTPVPQSSWHHIAISRSGTTLRYFLDGVLVRTSTYGYSLGSSNALHIGGGNQSGWYRYLNGYLTELRLTKGVCRYTASFTTMLIPYPNSGVDATHDLYFNFTELLLRSTGQVFTDQYNHVITTTGTVKPSNTNYKVGSYSAAFNGSSDYIDITCGSEFNIAGGDFTIELWVYFNVLGAQTILSKYTTWNTSVDFNLGLLANSTFRFTASNNIPITIYSTTVAVANQWYHLAVCRSGYHTKLFVNGVQEALHVASSALLIANTKTTLRIGAHQEGTIGEYVNGYIDNLRINRAARYTSNGFPLWTLPFPTYATTLDLRFEGADQSTVFNSQDGHGLVRSGTPVIATAIKKVGSSSGYFNGPAATDYISDDTLRGNLNNKFTIECWCYPLSIPTTLPSAAGSGSKSWILFGQGGSSGSQDQFLSYTVSQQFSFLRASALTGGTLSLLSVNTFPINTWHHVALTADGATWRLFINGNLECSVASTTSWVNTGNTFDVGRELVVGSPTWSSYWHGYIDNFKITNGLCKYTANFTPDVSLPTDYYEDFFTGYLANFAVWQVPVNPRTMLRQMVYQKGNVFPQLQNIPNAIAFWPLAERSGTLASDIIGTYPGTISGSPTMGNDVYLPVDRNRYESILLDGVDDQISIPTIKFGSAFSLLLWVDGVGSTLNTRLLEFTAASCDIFIDWNSGAFNTISVGIKDANGYQTINTAINICLADRNFIAITASSAGTLVLYLNGILINTINIAVFALSSPLVNLVGCSASQTNRSNVYVNNILLFNRQLSAAEVLSFFGGVYTARPTMARFLPTANNDSMAFYQSRYYLQGIVRMDAVPIAASVYIYNSTTGALEGTLTSDPTTGQYIWYTSTNQFYNVLCMPKYGQKSWVPNTLYSVGDIVIPFVQNGYYYICTTGGLSSPFYEPAWPQLLNATITDNAAVWTCKDVVTAGKVHGPVLPYDLNRAKYQATEALYPLQNITINGYIDTGSVATIDPNVYLYLNGTTANGLAGVNAKSALVTIGPSSGIDVDFARISSGSWYNDTFADAELRVYFFLAQDTSIQLSTAANNYYRPIYDAAKTIYVNLRSVYSSTPGVLSSTTGVTVSNGGFTTGHTTGTTTTKIRLTRVGDLFGIQIYENGVLKYALPSILTVTGATTCFILLHYHNYSNSAHQEQFINLTIQPSP